MNNKSKPLNRSINLLNFMKSKYLMLFLIFFLFLPIVHARYYANYDSSFNDGSYCQIFVAKYLPDETGILSSDQKMWFYTKPVTNNYNISVNYNYYYVNENVTNSTNESQAGFWSRLGIAAVDSFNEPRIDLPWYVQMFGGPTGAIVSQINFASSVNKVFFNVKTGEYSLLNTSQSNTIYFDLTTTTSYRIIVCQNASRQEAVTPRFIAKIGFPDTKYAPCDTKHFINYLFEWFYSLFAVLMEFVALITETWFILYWILKIGIIIGVVFGSIWLIMYIYRLVRDTLR